MASFDSPFSALCPEVKWLIFVRLDYCSLSSALQVCKEWNSIIDETIWRNLCFRDWKDYLEPPFPLCDDVDPRPIPETIVPETQKGEELNITDWKEFYRACLATPDLNGIFSAIYGDHGEELMQITHKGFFISVLKITGDPNVPAGKISWYATLCKSRKKGWGKIQVAEYGYLNPSWRGAFVDVIDKDKLELTWFFNVAHYTKEYHRTFTRITQNRTFDQEEEQETDEDEFYFIGEIPAALEDAIM